MMDQEELSPDLPAEAPEQRAAVKWEFKPRRNPKWGTVTKAGLVTGRAPNQRVVDPDEVYRMSLLGCTMEEMAQFFQIDRETLKYNFWDYIKQGESETRQRLRNAQIELALKGNATMLIWLGKQMLGQSDNPVNQDASKILPWQDQVDTTHES
jgi:hypothetical protein